MSSPTLTAETLASLSRDGISWALLRDDLDQGADTDILVAEGDLDRVMALVAEHGFGRLLTWRHGVHRFLVAYDQANDRWAKLDIVTRIAFRSGREMPEDVVPALLRRASGSEDQVRLAPDDEFWLLLLHCVLDKRDIEEHRFARLAELSTLLTDEPAGPAWTALQHAADVKARIVALVRARDAAGLLARAGDLQAHLHRPGAMTRSRRWFVGRLTPVLKALLRPGLTVAVLGPDGAGKSSLISAISGTFYFPTRSYYVGLYGATQTRRRVLGFALPWQLVRAWRAYLGGIYHRRRGRLVIFDRYGYDALLPHPGDVRPSPKARLRRLLIGLVCPKPDMVVVLDASAAELYARKQEHGIAALEAQRAGFRRLAERLRSKAHVEVIDAGQSMDTVRRQVMAAMWHRVTSRRPPGRLSHQTTIESRT